MERVQKRALRIPYELQRLDGYNERLSAVGLITLEVRRDRGDLIQAYKLIKGLEQVDNHCISKIAPTPRNKRSRLGSKRKKQSRERKFQGQGYSNQN